MTFVSRESRLANFARDCLLPSLVSMYHPQMACTSGHTLSHGTNDWAASNRVHAMYFASLADNTCAKGELITWRLGGFPSIWVVKIGLQRSSGSVWVIKSELATACHAHRVTQQTQQVRLQKMNHQIPEFVSACSADRRAVKGRL